MDSILEGATWRKSSRSGNSGGSCVELACAGEARGIRDSKNPGGSMLILDQHGVAQFLAAVKAGRLG